MTTQPVITPAHKRYEQPKPSSKPSVAIEAYLSLVFDTFFLFETFFFFFFRPFQPVYLFFYDSQLQFKLGVTITRVKVFMHLS